MKHVVEKIYRWPITHGYAAVLLAQGTTLLVTPVQLPGNHIYTTALSVIAALAGLLILTGLQWRRDPILALHLEKIGHIFGAATWAFELGMVWYLLGGPSADNLTSVIFLIASAVKAVRLHRKAQEAGINLEGAIRRSDEENSGSAAA